MTTLGPSNLTLELPAATPDFTARVNSGLGLLVECRITGSRDFHENTLLKTLSSIIKINQNLCTVAKFLSRVRCRRSWMPWMPVPYFMNNRVPRSRQSLLESKFPLSFYIPYWQMLLIAEESIPLKGFASSFVLLRNYLIFFHSKSLQSYQGGNCWSL